MQLSLLFRAIPLWAFIALVLCVLIFNNLTSTTPLQVSIKDSGHLYTFFFFGIVIRAAFAAIFPKLSKVRLNLLVFAAAGASGLAVEVMQPYFDRQFSWFDWLYDLVGVVFSLLYPIKNEGQHKETAELRSGNLSKDKGYAILILGAVLITSNILPAYQLYVLHQQKHQLPMLYSFESTWEERLTQTEAPNQLSFESKLDWPANNSNFALLTLTGEVYPGIALEHFWPDWSTYELLQFDLFSYQAEPIMLHLRIHDAWHNHKYQDRFNDKLVIEPGYNNIKIELRRVKIGPVSRDLDMQNVRRIMIFAQSSTPTNEIKFALDNITLVK